MDVEEIKQMFSIITESEDKHGGYHSLNKKPRNQTKLDDKLNALEVKVNEQINHNDETKKI